MLHEGQIEKLGRLGSALWSDPDQKIRATHQAVEAIALIPGTDEALMGTAAQAMLKRALRESRERQAESLEIPFYHLSSIERFALMAVSVGWSYLDLARLMEMAPDQVGQLLWNARIDLGARLGVKHPVGSGKGPSCPEYKMEEPWTQKFLDEEISVRERLFLQNHLMACDSCRRCLEGARKLYYAVEKVLPGLEPKQKEQLLFAHQTFVQGRSERFPELRSFGESVIAFILKNREIQWMLSALFLFSLISFLKKFS